MRLPAACGPAAMLLPLLLGGCGLKWIETARPPVPPPAEEPPARAEPVQKTRPLSARTREMLASRGLAVMDDRPLNVRTDCAFRDETGYGGNLDLEVRDAGVRRFAARVSIPNRGNCRFDLRDFRQTAARPTVMLAGGACTVRMWEQGDQVTVAFSACQAQCDAGTFDYLWPILVDAPSGRCF